MKKVCIFLGSRANYSSLKSVMRAIDAHPRLSLQLVVGASAVLDRFGRVEKLARADGFEPQFVLYNSVEGENPETMARSTGLGLIDISLAFGKLQPDMVVVVGDRYEMMSVTLAAAYMNIRIVHTMGGEVTGTIDESIRHAITKFSHIHFPANDDARERIIRLGEDPSFVFNVGCPRIDSIAEELNNDSTNVLETLFEDYGGVGGDFDLSRPFLLVSQHPVTTEYGCNRKQIEETLAALHRLKLPVIMLWPNSDAGSDDISKGIRSFRESVNPKWLRIFKNLPVGVYTHLMNTTACLVGNSSSGLREGAFIGTPVVNIGSRQQNRLCTNNVRRVDYDSQEIETAIIHQLEHGKYPRSYIYGNGTAGPAIADIISRINPPIQKTICY
jgi:UDP-hydrolysing UDP-N-acetyl-D-glucosamine 2-epimerase